MKGSMDQPSRKKVTVGCIFTALWVVIVVVVVYPRMDDLSTMSLNALGDFLAGVVAPLILIWVIIGIYQTQDDLRLQIKEISQMANASARQAQATEASVEWSKEQDERAARPQMMPWGSGSGSEGQRVDIKNRGGDAYNVELHYEGDHTMSLDAHTVWETDAVCTLRVKEKPISRSQVEPFKFPI